MRSLLAVLVLGLLVAGCGGGSSATPATAPASAVEPAVAEGLVICEQEFAEDARRGPGPSDAIRTDCLEILRRLAQEEPRAVYPSTLSPDGDWTARELLDWTAANARPQLARAAQAEIGKLP